MDRTHHADVMRFGWVTYDSFAVSVSKCVLDPSYRHRFGADLFGLAALAGARVGHPALAGEVVPVALGLGQLGAVPPGVHTYPA